jgi:release factor glutamine methyltransferase
MAFTITPISKSDIDALIRDKYGGDTTADISDDLRKLGTFGEPLAYVIGWQPFLGLKISLGKSGESRPLIPRPETEWWTEKLINHLAETKKPLRILDLCAGSGAIGLAIFSKNSEAHVSFGELTPEFADLIKENASSNAIDSSRMDVRSGNLFEPFTGEKFDIIATNPPYIPSTRELDAGVARFEPHEALFAGTDGLDVIKHILTYAPQHLNAGGELWMECDTSNIEAAAELARASGAGTTIHEDLYGRPRLLVAHFG